MKVLMTGRNASSLAAEPVFTTPLTEGRPNLLAHAKRLGKLLGIDDLVPWQERAVALATEYEVGHPADEWEWDGKRVRGVVPYYKTITITVPRQTGKTEIVEFLLWMLRFLGLFVDKPPLLIYIAQTQADAKRVISTKIWPRLQMEWGKQAGFFYSSAAEDPHIRMSGQKTTDFSKGKLSILANKSGSGLGMTSSYINIDEAREMGDSAREDALVPQMNTTIGPQMLVCSTMGNEESIYFNAKVDAGRELVVAQNAGRMMNVRRAYLEYGVGDVRSEDYDVEDQSVWLRAHPLIGFHNWSLERMVEEYDRAKSDLNIDGFRNNYLNQRMSEVDVPAIPSDWMNAVTVPEIPIEACGSPAVLGLNSAADSDYVGAAVSGNGKLQVVLTHGEDGPPTRVSKFRAANWLTGYLERHRNIRRVAVIAEGEMDAALRDWRRSGVVVERIPFGLFRKYCYNVLRAISAEEIDIGKSKWLRMAVYSAERQESTMANAWYWRRKEAVNAPIDELMAATLAWGLHQEMASKPKVRVV